jgi:hypothetical protein
LVAEHVRDVLGDFDHDIPCTRRTPAIVPARNGRTMLCRVLLSDADLRKELEVGRLVLDPWDLLMQVSGGRASG